MNFNEKALLHISRHFTCKGSVHKVWVYCWQQLTWCTLALGWKEDGFLLTNFCRFTEESAFLLRLLFCAATSSEEELVSGTCKALGTAQWRKEGRKEGKLNINGEEVNINGEHWMGWRNTPRAIPSPEFCTGFFERGEPPPHYSFFC